MLMRVLRRPHREKPVMGLGNVVSVEDEIP